MWKSATETFLMMQLAYGKDCLSRSKVFEWYARFKNSRESLEDDPRDMRPSTSVTDENIKHVCAALSVNYQLSVQILSEEIGISVGSIYTIVHDVLGKRKLCARFVPHSLTAEQKERVEASRGLVEWADDNPNFLQNIVTGDDSWCFQYDPSTKHQTAEWRNPGDGRPMKVRATKSKVKTMLITFFYSRGLIHKEFLPPGQTVTGPFYKEVLDRLLKRIRRVRPEMYRSGEWFLLHDKAPVHSSLIVSQFLAGKSVTVINHPPYSPDLAPADFFLFPKLKVALKGQRFDNVETIQKNVTAVLNTISKENYRMPFNVCMSDLKSV